MSDNTTTWLNDYEDINNGLMKPLFFMSNNINRSTTNLAGAITRRLPNLTNYRIPINNHGSIMVQGVDGPVRFDRWSYGSMEIPMSINVCFSPFFVVVSSPFSNIYVIDRSGSLYSTLCNLGNFLNLSGYYLLFRCKLLTINNVDALTLGERLTILPKLMGGLFNSQHSTASLLSPLTSVTTSSSFSPTYEANRVAVKFPPYWPKDPQLWFLQVEQQFKLAAITTCLLYTSPSPRDKRQSRMPSSA